MADKSADRRLAMDDQDKLWRKFMDIRDSRGKDAAIAFGLKHFEAGSANAKALRKGYFPTPEDEVEIRRTWTVAANFLSGRPWNSGLLNEQGA
jgi:hypothetical protein